MGCYGVNRFSFGSWMWPPVGGLAAATLLLVLAASLFSVMIGNMPKLVLLVGRFGMRFFFHKVKLFKELGPPPRAFFVLVCVFFMCTVQGIGISD